MPTETRDEQTRALILFGSTCCSSPQSTRTTYQREQDKGIIPPRISGQQRSRKQPCTHRNHSDGTQRPGDNGDLPSLAGLAHGLRKVRLCSFVPRQWNVGVKCPSMYMLPSVRNQALDILLCCRYSSATLMTPSGQKNPEASPRFSFHRDARPRLGILLQVTGDGRYPTSILEYRANNWPPRTIRSSRQ